MIAKTLAELEDVLAEELVALGAECVETGTRMVSFMGDKALMYKTNVHCRTALRILKPFYSFRAESADEVYEAVKRFDWEGYLSPDTTFSIDAVVFSHIFTHSKYVAYKVKDAIADWFNERLGKRPSVSISNPDIVLHVHVAHNRCTLSFDSSGESLHKRGYRTTQGEAPLNEVLAAGMILKSGWRGECDFIDPMCGSGTLLIEAAMIALGIPPGIHRTHFAFEKWRDFDSELFSAIYNDESGAREFNHRIMGFDISPKAVAMTGNNVRNAGLRRYIDLAVKPFQQFAEAPAKEGVLMTNPPYGERLRVEDLNDLYGMIGERLKHVFPGYRAYVLSYRKEAFEAIGLRHSRRFFLYNGALECEMREYELFSGKREDRPVREGFRDGDRPGDEDAHHARNMREGFRRSRRAEEAGDGYSRDRRFRMRDGDERERPAPRPERRDVRLPGGAGGRFFAPDRDERSDRPFKSRERDSRPFYGDRERDADKPFKPGGKFFERDDKPERPTRSSAPRFPFRKK
ncbi:MAG: THUMP domain-containing protein [Proteiniphilum sp.]|nr:THUMP domain-containing protein [Proteiniphilum sp.]